MLEDIEQIAINETVYRLANPLRVRAALGELGTSWDETAETIDFLQTVGADEAAVLLVSPFSDSPNFSPQSTRFSDGTWKVFYSALEPETSEAERGYWCRRNIQSEPPALRRFHYRELRCRVNGHGFDTRPKLEAWSFLTGDSSFYPQCQALAREAKEAKADAMLCPSARHPGGTTVPVFVVEALSDAIILGFVVIQIDAQGQISVSRPTH